MTTAASGSAAAAVTDDLAPPTLPARSQQEQDQLVQHLTAFLKQDLPHLFDDQGIDSSKYEPGVVFEDPITYYNGIDGYLFNIAFLRKVFTPTFTLHDVRRTAPLELTTRWTMAMSLSVARGTPLGRVWDPTLCFTGTSIMGVDPETGRFNRHSDTWDAVQQQRYFSVEAFLHMLSQVGDLHKGPEAPGQYEVLLKRKQYEVRRYGQLPPTATGSSSSSSDGDDAIFAAAGFIGAAENAAKAEAALRSALQKDGLQPEAGRRLLVPGGKGSLLAKRRSEVLIPLTAFQLW